MSTAAPNAYLRNAVMTATPEQLQLMLYDGAIRFTHQGADAIERQEYEGAFHALSRAQKIVLELRGGLNRDVNPQLCDRMAQLYIYIYQRLVDGNVHRDVDAIQEAARLLEYQRETWILLIEKLGQEHESALNGKSVPDAGDTSMLSIEG